MRHPPTPLDRFLRLFTEVRTGEGVTAVLLAVNVFLILTAYYVVKVLREPLILTGGGAEIRSYSAAGQVLLLAAAVPLYGRLAGRLPRRRLINLVTAFFIGCLVLFFALARAGTPIGVAFFLWVGIFNVMVVAQFWSFANDVYTTDEGKRLFPIVGFGASAGAVFGAGLPGLLIEPTAPARALYPLFLLSGVLLGLATVISNLVDGRERRRRAAERTDTMPAATGEYRADTGEFRVPQSEYLKQSGEIRAVKKPDEAGEERPADTAGAFQLVFRNRYLLLIAFLMLFLNWVNTTGEYILSRTVERAAEAAVADVPAGTSSEAFIGSFYSSFYSVVNVAGLLLQLFVVSRILKYLGVRVALLMLPALALGGYALLAFFPVLTAVRWVKTAENSTDYSLQNTVRNVLFLPTTREQKYKAKQAIDSFFWRAGDVLSAALVFVGTTYLLFETEQFAMVNMALVAVWLTLAVFIGRRYMRLAASTAR